MMLSGLHEVDEAGDGSIHSVFPAAFLMFRGMNINKTILLVDMLSEKEYAYN